MLALKKEKTVNKVKVLLYPVFLVLVFGLVSCTAVKQSLYRLGFRSYKSLYTEDLAKNTKSYILYRDFSTVAQIKVTHFNKTLFEEYIKGIIKGDPRAQKYKPFLKQFNKYDIYYVAFYTPDMTINNLESNNSFWNVYLSSCGKIFRPESIKLIDKGDWRAGWLYSVGGDRWYREYIVKFNRDDGCQSKTFVVSSFLGTISLQFDVAKK